MYQDGSTSKHETILLIEDVEGFRKTYRAVLENEGYRVLEAEDGEQGLTMIESARPDLVLLDLVLPKIDGFEVLKRLRANVATKTLPVIILTVLGEVENIQRGLSLGANDYTVKGFYAPRQILSKIRALLTQSDIQQHLSAYMVAVKEGHNDAARLQQDAGFISGFRCPDCKEEMNLELTPDFTRPGGHWFAAHFICPRCNRAF